MRPEPPPSRSGAAAILRIAILASTAALTFAGYAAIGCWLLGGAVTPAPLIVAGAGGALLGGALGAIMGTRR